LEIKLRKVKRKKGKREVKTEIAGKTEKDFKVLLTIESLGRSCLHFEIRAPFTMTFQSFTSASC
jgi:hypothetical protein